MKKLLLREFVSYIVPKYTLSCPVGNFYSRTSLQNNYIKYILPFKQAVFVKSTIDKKEILILSSFFLAIINKVIFNFSNTFNILQLFTSLRNTYKLYNIKSKNKIACNSEDTINLKFFFLFKLENAINTLVIYFYNIALNLLTFIKKYFYKVFYHDHSHKYSVNRIKNNKKTFFQINTNSNKKFFNNNTNKTLKLNFKRLVIKILVNYK